MSIGWRRIALALAAGGMVVTSVPAGAQGPERTVTVVCDRGESIASALAAPPAERSLVIVVAGTCREPVTITRDDVTLRGHDVQGGVLEGDPARDTIVVDGARRVTLEALTFAGGRNGLVATGGATVTLRRTTLRGHLAPYSAVLARRGSEVALDESVVTDNAGSGITVADASSATLLSSQVLNNGFGNPQSSFGITAVRGGVVWLGGGNQVAGNTIGIFVRGGHLRIGEGSVAASDQIVGNNAGISATDNSVLDLRGSPGGEIVTLVSGNAGNGIVAQMGTVLRLRSITIAANGGHGIIAFYDAGIGFFVPYPNYVTVTGNAGYGVFCGDDETSLTGDVRGVIGNGQGEVSCSGF